jgi:hypothetical protein
LTAVAPRRHERWHIACGVPICLLPWFGRWPLVNGEAPAAVGPAALVIRVFDAASAAAPQSEDALYHFPKLWR